jgi:hypothetical protein
MSVFMSNDELLMIQSLSDGFDKSSAAPNGSFNEIHKSIPVYHLPEGQLDVGNKQRRLVMSMMTLGARSTDPEPTKWQSWVLSYTLLFYPDLLPKFRADPSSIDYVFQEYPGDFLQSCRDVIAAQSSVETAGDQIILLPDGMPNTSLIPWTLKLAESSSLENLYAHFAMVVLIFGKSKSRDNLVAFTTKRPKALIARHKLQNADYLLLGDGKPDPKSYELITSGFTRSDRPRFLVIHHLAALVAHPHKSEIHSPVVVNMSLLKNAAQSYLVFVQKLLLTMPWVPEDIPAVRPELKAYILMCRHIRSFPTWFRPYVKLAYQDHETIIARASLPILLALGATLEAQSSKSMANYRIDEGKMGYVAQFIELAKEKGVPLKSVENQQLTETEAV